jgi:RNA polymerase sigma-70 factor (ECF subfamily)
MVSIASGDPIAFARFYTRFSVPLLNLARNIVRSPAAAEDVRQEAFQEIWNRAAEYRASLGSPFSWIMTIARHKAIDRLRAEVRRLRQIAEYDAEISPLVASEERGADFRALAEEAGDAVRGALSQLSALEREAVECAYFEGLSSGEMSQRLHIPVGTIKSRLRRALRHLQRPLADFRHASRAPRRDFSRTRNGKR